MSLLFIKCELLLNNISLTKNFIRNKSISLRSRKKWPGGKPYYKFTYYPRYPNEEDPPIEPAKLLMIKRVKQYRGNPYWEREILTRLKLDNKMSDIAIVENSAHMNAELWKIKHLIKITPITFPDGEPNENDYAYSYLNEFGEFRIHNSLKADPERLKAAENLMADSAALDPQTVKDLCRQRWVTSFDWNQVE